jgi:hypothetical protein
LQEPPTGITTERSEGVIPFLFSCTHPPTLPPEAGLALSAGAKRGLIYFIFNALHLLIRLYSERSQNKNKNKTPRGICFGFAGTFYTTFPRQ